MLTKCSFPTIVVWSAWNASGYVRNLYGGMHVLWYVLWYASVMSLYLLVL